MIEILEGPTLELENVISFRGSVNQAKVESIGRDMEEFVAQAGANKIGNPITATYGIDVNKIDIELLMSIDKQIENLHKYI